MLEIVDWLCQVIIAVFGLFAIILVAQGNRWGFVAGLVQQPFWIFTTIYNQQMGIFLLSLAYLVSWILGVYNNFFKEKDTGMSKEKMLAVVHIYRAMFSGKNIGKIDYDHDVILHDPVCGMAHCHGMLDKMEEFVHQGRRDKFSRWLGFLQGFLWLKGVYTLKELKDHNRPS